MSLKQSQGQRLSARVNPSEISLTIRIPLTQTQDLLQKVLPLKLTISNTQTSFYYELGYYNREQHRAISQLTSNAAWTELDEENIVGTP